MNLKRRILKLMPPFLRQKLVFYWGSARTAPAYKKSLTRKPGCLSFVAAYTRHGGYAIPLSSIHRPAAQQVLKGSVHELDTIQYILNCLKTEGGDIVHAGTYFGDMLPQFSCALSKDQLVWAFEPNRENFRCAEITIKINDLTNVVLRHAGLGGESGMKDLTVTNHKDNVALGGRSRFEEIPSGDTESVDIVALDDVIPTERNISLIHLDVEGYEKKAIQGALKTIKQNLPILILETVPDDNFLQKYLKPLGYKAVGKVNINTILSTKEK